MRRLILLLILTLTLAFSAFAEAPDPLAALEEVYPDPQIVSSAQDEDDAFFVLDMGKGAPQKLCGLSLEDGIWRLTIDSDKAIRPSGLSDCWNVWNYDKIALTLSEDTLSIHYSGWPQWQYDFVRDENAAWRFVRLFVDDQVNTFSDELTWADGCVRQTFVNEYRDGTQEVSHTPPCPMPWLSGCETLSGFDAAAFPMDLGWISEEELARAAAELLPGYTFVSGKFSTVAATFLMDNPAGELVFMGGVYEDGAWVWTESTPLPADTWCDSFHAGAGAMSIGFDHPGGEPDEWGDVPYAEYVIYLQEDGRWMVESIFDYFGEWFHFEADGLYINMTGKVYGESSLERDITKIHWADYPLTLDDVLPTLSDDWGVIGEPSLPLYADAAGSILVAEYLYATPVHVLAAARGQEGDLAQVQIADSDVVGWMPVCGLLLGADQLWEYTVTYEDESWTSLVTAEEAPYFLDMSVDSVTLPAGANMYAAPEGEILFTSDESIRLPIMADCGNGWYHVRHSESAESFYVRAEDCTAE